MKFAELEKLCAYTIAGFLAGTAAYLVVYGAEPFRNGLSWERIYNTILSEGRYPGVYMFGGMILGAGFGWLLSDGIPEPISKNDEVKR